MDDENIFEENPEGKKIIEEKKSRRASKINRKTLQKPEQVKIDSVNNDQEDPEEEKQESSDVPEEIDRFKA